MTNQLCRRTMWTEDPQLRHAMNQTGKEAPMVKGTQGPHYRAASVGPTLPDRWQ
jgi:hypothetical protein